MTAAFARIITTITSLVQTLERNRFGAVVLLSFGLIGLIGFALYVLLKCGHS